LQKEITPFFNRISEILASNRPFVTYRKPNEELVSVIAQTNNNLYELTNFDQVGFVFCPFHESGKKVLFPVEECELFSTKITQFDNLSIKVHSEKLMINGDVLSKGSHLKLVKKGVDFIKLNKAKKIVLSRKEVISYSKLDVLNTFKKMLSNYVNAFVYVWFHPSIGLWMGATPERLINLKEQNIKTMALAGTQPFLGSMDVQWHEKEKNEQQYVTDFILQNIKITVKNIQAVGPYTVKAGNLLHLRTDITGELITANSLEKIVNSLHPTPAVCGLPKQVATQFILENEGYDRTYYSGYLGELNMIEKTHLFVNLRCMQIEKKTVSIYIGGGITEDSIPINEYEETVSKAAVMKKVLGFHTS
jgi:isochorismate synthase